MKWILQSLQADGRLDLEGIEFALRSQMQKVSAVILQGITDLIQGGYRGSQIFCKCGQKAPFKGYRSKPLLTVVGEIRISRAYYYCSACEHGIFPQDEEWDIVSTEFSPGVKRLMGRMGAREAFLPGSEDLQELAGIRVEAKAIERVAEEIGTAIRSKEFALQEAIMKADVLASPTRKVEIVYITMDGTGVPVVGKEVIGRKGKAADGRARTREAKLGCIFTQTGLDQEGRPVRDEDSSSYVGIIEESQEFGKEMYAELQRRGLQRARLTVAIGDGAAWIWEVVNEHFPGAVEIIDLYHAREHLWKVARAVYIEQDKRRNLWAKKRIKELDRGDITSILKAFRRLTIPDPDTACFIQTELQFFRKNRNRMQYALFRKLGLFVGSGVVEAGCKTVIGQRLKQSGMHWTVRGANSIITLRRCIMNGEWENFWALRSPA